MRDIKFRAWEKVREDETGSYGGEMYYSEESEEKRACGFVIKTNSGYSNDDFQWMQYTGLKDKNGKEIYEGDIVSTDSLRYEVKFGSFDHQDIDSYGYYLDCEGKGKYTYSMTKVTVMLVEVIGNVYENPELLEDE